MKVTDFTYLLQQPEKINSPVQINQLEEILENYPYFQAAHAIHLKGLKNLNSFKYNNALKITAAHTANRDVLFNFITSPEFLNATTEQNNILETPTVEKIISLPKEPITAKTSTSIIDKESADKPLPQNLEDAKNILDETIFETKETTKEDETVKLNIGEPLEFTKKEKHSFAQWLELTLVTPEENSGQNTETKKEKKNLKSNKFDLIDKFLQSNPKIVPKKNLETKINISASTKLNKDELMTETLAKVYLEQKKYKKAIQAYKILSLKYPEKSSFFADLIKSVEKIHKENI